MHGLECLCLNQDKHTNGQTSKRTNEQTYICTQTFGTCPDQKTDNMIEHYACIIIIMQVFLKNFGKLFNSIPCLKIFVQFKAKEKNNQIIICMYYNIIVQIFLKNCRKIFKWLFVCIII